jgi:phosphatidylserine decarboxylase
VTRESSPVRRERLPFLIGVIALTVAAAFTQIFWLTVLTALLALQTIWFFRDPRRIIPDGDELIVSPADGKIVEVTEAEEERFLQSRAVKVSIFLNLFDVHVNRIPCAGRIRGIQYQPGKFLAASKALASTENEQNALLLETPSGARLVFVQVAGLVARRIVCWVKDGDRVQKGDRFGMIRFGSRTDLFLPLGTEIRIRKGQKVKGGSSVIGALK